MHTIKLKVEDTKLDIVLTILENIKKDVITDYTVVESTKENKEFIKASEKSLESIWDNSEDSVYDTFLTT
jgi:hypothetical protein